MPHRTTETIELEKARTVVKDAAASGPLRIFVLLLFAGQLMVGQLLPLLGQRDGTIVVGGLASTFGRAESIGLVSLVVLGLLLSILRRVIQVYSALFYSAYILLVAWIVLPKDPFVSALFVMFGAFGIWLAAASLPVRAQRG